MDEDGTIRALAETFATVLTCPTCHDTGWATIPNPTDSAWFPKPSRRVPCPNCLQGLQRQQENAS